MIETNLVDFRSLDLDTSSTRRNELMRGVASLFAFASERCTLEQIEIYDDVMSRLADMVEREALVFAAEKIAPLRRAPENVVRRFAAHDDLTVAGPILEKSPVLNERDLLGVAETKGNGHLQAIAHRSYLSEAVTESVVRRGDAEVRRTVAGNHGAVLGEQALSEIVRQAMFDVATATALGTRPDTPDAVIDALSERAAEEVQRALKAHGSDRPVAELQEAARRAAERMSNTYWLGLYDFESAWEKLMNQGGRRVASEPLLFQYAMEDRFADVVAVYAVLADLSLEEAKHWMVRTDVDPFITSARALGFKITTVQILLKSGPWKHRLSPNQRRDALNAFTELDPRQARARMQVWRDTRATT
ncbi:DUF2336 domain-containing protein [Chthonobacter rhizosphaerae]|uniref:DUF2336 domain-containing protein n=1 Tax=Chthonobacter rhizosphaerae TaxID=2735553 RepID=UPI0015EF99E6|nr:DUF2336 domain-containing protein [Chthonobacter rhizosphaerae]